LPQAAEGVVAQAVPGALPEAAQQAAAVPLVLGPLAAVQRLAEQGPAQARWAHRPAQLVVSPGQTAERQPALLV
jgi:hypothetical protein